MAKKKLVVEKKVIKKEIEEVDEVDEENDTQYENIDPEETIEDEEIISEEDLEDMEEAIEEVKKEESLKTKLSSFVIEVVVFQNFLNDIRGKGYDSSSSTATDLITDCILRLDTKNKHLWTIVVDNKRNFVAQKKQIISEIIAGDDIPIDIKEMEKWLKTFESDDIIKVVYENGIIALKNIMEKDDEYRVKTDLMFLTKRKEAVSCDLIQDLEYGDEADIKNLKTLKKLGNSVYKVNDKDICTVSFGAELKNSFEMGAKQLKKIIDDGERIGNRIYPFEFLEDRVKIVVQSADESDADRIIRSIYAKNYNIKEPFEVKFASRLTNAVNNLSGNIKIYVQEKLPMLIKSLKTKEDGSDLCYLITTF